MDENLQKFLYELSLLSNKYGFYICGCGCCGSPSLDDIEGNTVGECLEFDPKSNKYILED
jgi:hypothetical protein